MGTIAELKEAMDYISAQQHRIEIVYQPDWNVDRLAQDVACAPCARGRVASAGFS
jgi:hypothetical protein